MKLQEFFAISGDEIINLDKHETHAKAREAFKRLAASRLCNIVVNQDELQTLSNLIKIKLDRLKPVFTPEVFTRIDNDGNGNPRYVCHYTLFNAATYGDAVFRARNHGGKKYHTKRYGGGVVFQCYNLQDLCDRLNAAIVG